LGIDPIAFTIGHLAVPWYAMAMVVAVITVIIMARREAGGVGIPSKVFWSAATWAVVGGAMAAKLVHVVDWWGHYSAHSWEIFRLEGWALYGAILGALLAVWVHARIGGISFWRWGDVAAPGAALGQAIGRVGCTIQGCCYGLPTSLPWAIVYTHPRSYAPLGVALHPAQVYFLLWNLVVFAVLRRLRRRLKSEGSLFLVYLALYSAGDFGLRFLRQGDPFLFGLHQAQVIGLAILAVVVPLLVVRTRWGKRLTFDYN
jgi:phosphatidylglycerol:prolipoprotein diacylglycerol transferase